MNTVIVGVDTGNRCIKTAHNVFISGIRKFPQSPSFSHGILKYQDGYYMLSNDRVSYLQDKTETDEYFVLSLFAIVQEMQKRKITIGTEPVPVMLGVGLPPSHLQRLKGKFHDYFARGIVSFELDKQNISLDILEVQVFAQGYAAIYADFPTIKKIPKSYIVDIGGYTTDVISLDNGIVDPRFCESLDYGVIQLYNTISRKIHAEFGRTPDENQIDEMLRSGKDIHGGMLKIAQDETSFYVDEMLRKLSEMGIDLVLATGIFVGGGSERFRSEIEKSKRVFNPYFSTDIHANANGYEAFVSVIKK